MPEAHLLATLHSCQDLRYVRCEVCRCRQSDRRVRHSHPPTRPIIGGGGGGQGGPPGRADRPPGGCLGGGGGGGGQRPPPFPARQTPLLCCGLQDSAGAHTHTHTHTPASGPALGSPRLQSWRPPPAACPDCCPAAPQAACHETRGRRRRCCSRCCWCCWRCGTPRQGLHMVQPHQPHTDTRCLWRLRRGAVLCCAVCVPHCCIPASHTSPRRHTTTHSTRTATHKRTCLQQDAQCRVLLCCCGQAAPQHPLSPKGARSTRQRLGPLEHLLGVTA
jgi:hypothetical protein